MGDEITGSAPAPQDARERAALAVEALEEWLTVWSDADNPWTTMTRQREVRVALVNALAHLAEGEGAS